MHKFLASKALLYLSLCLLTICTFYIPPLPPIPLPYPSHTPSTPLLFPFYSPSIPLSSTPFLYYSSIQSFPHLFYSRSIPVPYPFALIPLPHTPLIPLPFPFHPPYAFALSSLLPPYPTPPIQHHLTTQPPINKKPTTTPPTLPTDSTRSRSRSRSPSPPTQYHYHNHPPPPKNNPSQPADEPRARRNNLG